MSKIPIVAIVGRANVGKSSLFNRLVNQRQAVVADEPGTTRDAVYGRVETAGGIFTVVDTAGLKDASDEFEASIQEQIADAAGVADVIIVVADGASRIADEDRRVAKLAHKTGQPVILAINKAEAGRPIDQTEFLKLGIKTTVLTSATQNRGMTDLIQAVLKHVKPLKTDTAPGFALALIGRPNVGKSSLFNALGKKQQAVVADKAGTTRDVNRLSIRYHGQEVTLLDTAGIRKSGKIEQGIERFSVMRAVAAIDESDICVLVVDANEAGVMLDQKLAGIIKEAGKGLILAITKWDLIDKDAFTHDQLLKRLKSEFQHAPWALYTATSAATGQNVTRLLELAIEIRTERAKKLKTSELNRWLGESVNRHPPAGLKNVHPKLRYVTQTGSNPPQITIFGSGVRVLHWSYKRYLERELRETFGFAGTPVKILFKDKEPGIRL